MRKLFSIVATLALASFALTGCMGDPGTKETPATIGEDSWSIRYVYINPADSIAIPCLWKYENNKAGAMSCDWENQTATIPPEQKQQPLEMVHGK